MGRDLAPEFHPEGSMSKLLRFLSVSTMFVCAATIAVAQTYPARTVTLVVPYGPGGGTDLLARALASELGTRLKQSVIVENTPGAGGTIAVQKVSNMAPDGYTLVLSNGIEFEMLQMADPASANGRTTNLTPIALIGTQPMVLVARSELGFKTTDDLVRAGRAKPGGIALASLGPGTSLFLAGEMIKKAAGISTLDVPYKSAPQIVTDLVAGNADAAVLTIPSVASQLQSRRITALSVTGRTRSPALPDVPSLSESQLVKGVDTKVWYGVFGPPKLPAAVIASIEQQVAQVVASPSFQEKLLSLSVTPAKRASARELDAIRSEQLSMYKEALPSNAKK
jgi:tripartite-type tricarboxylate transporter receptor subunit TctC